MNKKKLTEKQEEEIIKNLDWSKAHRTDNYSEQYQLGKNLIVVKNEKGEIIEKFYDNRIQIEQDVLEYFEDEKKVNEALRSIMNLNKMLNEQNENLKLKV